MEETGQSRSCGAGRYNVIDDCNMPGDCQAPPRVGREYIPHVALPGSPAQMTLIGGFMPSDAHPVFHRKTAVTADCPGQHQGLVEAACTESLRVQGDGNQCGRQWTLRFLMEAYELLGQDAGQCAPCHEVLCVLEAPDHPVYGGTECKQASAVLIRWWTPLADGAA